MLTMAESISSNDKLLTPVDQRLLEIQNGERTALGLPPLNWNPVLAEHAQSYANQLAVTGQLAHAPREGRGIERENLSKGLIGWGPDQFTRSWLAEKEHFRPGIFPNVSDTGNWYDVGHYSQLIWPETTDVGCGTANGGGFSWLVCRYSPGGNRDGKPVGSMRDICPQRDPGLAWNGGTVTITCTPVFFAAGGSEGTTTITFEGRPSIALPATPSRPTIYQWIDVKTGKPVPSVPLSGRNLGGGEGAGIARMEGYNPQAVHAFNPKTGQNFAKLHDGRWIDVKTGKEVPTAPLSGQNLWGGWGAGIVQMEGYDPQASHAFNPKTGESFAKVPIEQTQAAATPDHFEGSSVPYTPATANPSVVPQALDGSDEITRVGRKEIERLHAEGLEAIKEFSRAKLKKDSAAAQKAYDRVQGILDEIVGPWRYAKGGAAPKEAIQAVWNLDDELRKAGGDSWKSAESGKSATTDEAFQPAKADYTPPAETRPDEDPPLN